MVVPVETISGEVAGLLKVTVPVIVRALRKASYNSKLRSIDDELNEGARMLDPFWGEIPLDRKNEIRRLVIEVIDKQKKFKLQPWWKSFKSTELDALMDCKHDAAEWMQVARITSTEFNVLDTLQVDDQEPAAAVIPTQADIRLRNACDKAGTNSVEFLSSFAQLASSSGQPSILNVTLNTYQAEVKYAGDGVAYNNTLTPAGGPARMPEAAAGRQDVQVLDSSTDDAPVETEVIVELVKATEDVLSQAETQSLSFNPWY